MKKAVSLLLALCLALCLAAPALALDIPGGEAAEAPALMAQEDAKAASDDTWASHAADAFAGGSGTEADPYCIETAAQLAKLAKDINEKTEQYPGAYFTLTADIDLSAYLWVPIGFAEYNPNDGYPTRHMFTGVFDGGGHTISGLRVETATDYPAGLFGQVATEPDVSDVVQIKNLTVANASVQGAGDVGILAGMLDKYNHEEGQAEIIDCTVSGTVSRANPVDDYYFLGGAVGWATNGSLLKNITADISISGTNRAGGLVGKAAWWTQIENCRVTGSVSGGWTLGGFAGEVVNEAQIINCRTDADVTANDWCTGGFAGFAATPVAFENCVAAGNVTSTPDWKIVKTGGFIGEIALNKDKQDPVTINQCFVLGKVESTAGSAVGTFVGAQTDNPDLTCENCWVDREKNPDLPTLTGGTLDGVQEADSDIVQAVAAHVTDPAQADHHVYAWTVTVEPTVETEGLRTGVCYVHPGETVTESIPKLAAPPTPDTGITLDQTSLTLEPGQTAKLKATLTPADATYKYIFWTVDKTDIISVSDSGLVTAIAEGTAAVTAKSWYGNTATCAVTVKKADTPTPPDEPDQPDPWPTEGLAGFVTRLYRQALSREPDKAGHADWVRWLQDGTVDAKSCASGFIFSKEMNDKNLSDKAFVETLYKVFMDREGEASGVAFWTEYLAQGHTRREVFDGFADSKEFAGIVTGYGIG